MTNTVRESPGGLEVCCCGTHLTLTGSLPPFSLLDGSGSPWELCLHITAYSPTGPFTVKRSSVPVCGCAEVAGLGTESQRGWGSFCSRKENLIYTKSLQNDAF